MGIRLPTILHHAKSIFRTSSNISSSHASKKSDVPKGHFAVYVGENEKHRFVVPISYLKHPSFQELLRRAEEEYGFEHPMGGLTIPCSEKAFLNITSHLNEF